MMADSTEEYGNYSYEYEMEYGDIVELKVKHSQREAIHIISVVVYITAFVLGLIGNGAVIWVTGFKSKRTVNSIWLLNLAMADFVFVLSLPFYIDYILRDFHWGFGTVMCKLNSFVSVMNMYASVLFLTVLSIDRYVSLVHLSWSQKHRTVERAWVTCGVIWLLACALSSPMLILRDTLRLPDKVICFVNFQTQDFHTAAMRHVTIVVIRATVGFLLPFTAICVTGILLTIKVNRSQGTFRLSSFSKMVTVIILAFFICWTPFHIFCLMELSVHATYSFHNVLKAGFPLATSLVFFHSCINPLVYMLLGKKIRHIMKQAFLDLTKSSLREISQSVSATEIESVPEHHQEGSPEEPVELSTI